MLCNGPSSQRPNSRSWPVSPWIGKDGASQIALWKAGVEWDHFPKRVPTKPLKDVGVTTLEPKPQK
jgi:hypothetical protein